MGQIFDCEEELFSKKDRKTRLFGYVNMLGEYRVPPTFLKALPFAGKYAVVQQGKKFGVINCEGVLVVSADYDEIASFINGKGWMKINNLWGLVDAKGKVLIQPIYEEVLEINPFNGTVTWVKKNGLWGLINRENGRMIVQPAYEAVSSLSDSAGIGRKNGLQDLVFYGDGRIIIPQMRQVKKAGPGLFIYQNQDRKFGVFNRLAFITVRPAWDSLFTNETFIQTRKFGKYGLLNGRGIVLFEPEFDFISPVKGGFAGFLKEGNYSVFSLSGVKVGPEGAFSSGQLLPQGYAVFRKDEKEGLWELKQKKWLIPFEKQKLRISSNEKWLEVRQNDQARAFSFSKGLSATLWDSLEVRSNSDWILAYSRDKIQIVQLPDCQISKSFDQASRLSSNYFLVKLENRFGVLNPSGALLLTCEYNQIEHNRLPNGNPVFKVMRDNYFGLFNHIGKPIVPLQFENVLPTLTGPYPAKQKGKWGLVDGSGKWLSETQFDSISGLKIEGDIPDFPLLAWKKGRSCLLSAKGLELTELSKNSWVYLKQDVFGQKTGKGFLVFNNQGKAQGDQIFEQIGVFTEGNASVLQNGKWGFINQFGRMVIPAQFEAVLPFKNGVAFAKQNERWGVLKRNGSWLLKPVGMGIGTDESGNQKLLLP